MNLGGVVINVRFRVLKPLYRIYPTIKNRRSNMDNAME
jgi:hypothetical protein